MFEKALKTCETCFYRDYSSDTVPCCRCLWERIRTGKFPNYINAVYEEEDDNGKEG